MDVEYHYLKLCIIGFIVHTIKYKKHICIYNLHLGAIWCLKSALVLSEQGDRPTLNCPEPAV